MKKDILTLLFGFILLTGCSLDDNSNMQQNVTFYWNLIQVEGGVGDVDDKFELKTITWDFDHTTSKLKVVNNNNDDTKQSGLSSGTYDFAVKIASGKNYLIIDDDEMGRYTTTNTQLVIDENKLSGGNGTDGFKYTFRKSFRAIE